MKLSAKAADVEVFAKAAVESAATTAAAGKMGAKDAAAGEESPLRELLDSDQATTNGKISQPNLAEAELKFSEFRMRWIKRLDNSTDDLALKAKLLETLEDAYLAPVSALSDRDLNAVKDQFFQGLLSPVEFLVKLQNLLGDNP